MDPANRPYQHYALWCATIAQSVLAILAEFGLQRLDLRLTERVQPPEHAMPGGGCCRKFAMCSGRLGRYSGSSNLGSRLGRGDDPRRGRSSRAKRSEGGLGRPPGGPVRGLGGAPVPARSKLRAGERGPPPASRASRITILSASFTASESRNTRATSGSSAMAPSRVGARKRSPKGASRAAPPERGGRSARW